MVFLLVIPAAAQAPKADFSAPSVAITDNSTYIDANRILMFVTNHGNFGRDLAGVFGYDYGTWFPYTGDTAAISGNVGKAGDFSPNYATGLWVGATVENQTRVVVSEYSSEYVPGPMVNGTFVPDAPEFRVYKLYRDSLASNPNQDYLDWPVDQGAPVDADGNPDFIGDQMLWCVYNDADPGGHTNDAGETAPLGIEVKQTVFAFDRLGSLGNMVFARYRIYNKGSNVLNECYFSIWYDPDLGTAGDDFVGCDTLTDLGFVYNSDNDDGQYGVGPPAMGCDFFQGPLKGREAGDTLIDGTPLPDGRMWGQMYPDSVNLGLSSFNKYINGTDPDNFDETYGFMQGLTKEGVPYEYEGDTLMFVHTGDPVTGEGDLDIAPADRRWMQTTGPVTFNPGDSTEILIALIVGQGSNNLTSVTVVKNLDVFAQKLYEEGFNPPAAPARPVVTVATLPGEITLSWGDTSEVDPGEFPFEGYSVWQGPTPAGPWELLATYDVVNDREDAVAPLVDTLFDIESGRNLPIVMRSVKNTALRYHYRATMDALTNTPLRDLSKYYFRVSAFSFGYSKQNGDAVPNGDRFLESARDLTIIPRSPIAGVNPEAISQEILPVTHPTGASDGVIEPIVVDPTALTGHTYRLTFTDGWGVVPDTVWDYTELTDTCEWEQADSIGIDSSVTPWDTTDIIYWEPILCVETTLVEVLTDSSVIPVWNLDDMTTGQRVVDGWDNQAANEDFLVVDGIFLRVMGPPPGYKLFEVVANANGPLDPTEAGAAEFRDFPVPADAAGDPLRPTDAQQATGDGLWMFHTADNGGSSAGGTRYSFAAFISRTLRDGGNDEALGGTDYEMRFTGTNDDPGTGGSYVIEWFNDDNVFWVPYELWQTGVATPDDPSDDVRLVSFIIDDWGPNFEGDDIYALESWGSGLDASGSGDWEHSVSGGDDDPFTDWVYWYRPIDDSPGEAGYLAEEAAMLAGGYGADGVDAEIMARTVLVNWNGGVEPPFTMDVPEMGTIFRIQTNKPNFPADTFFFTAPAPQLTSTETDLDLIKAVPNPFYLTSGYDPNPGSYAIKFHHLPETCTIRIYNLAGELVRTLEKDDPATPIAEWDILTENGLPVASGIYIYVVDAEGFGQKIGKMAVFVEKEVLDIY
jgi:hypothetical protein